MLENEAIANLMLYSMMDQNLTLLHSSIFTRSLITLAEMQPSVLGCVLSHLPCCVWLCRCSKVIMALLAHPRLCCSFAATHLCIPYSLFIVV